MEQAKLKSWKGKEYGSDIKNCQSVLWLWKVSKCVLRQRKKLNAQRIAHEPGRETVESDDTMRWFMSGRLN